MRSAQTQRTANWVTIGLVWMFIHTALAAPNSTVEREADEFVSHFITALENLELPAFMECFAADATAFFPVPEPPGHRRTST